MTNDIPASKRLVDTRFAELDSDNPIPFYDEHQGTIIELYLQLTEDGVASLTTRWPHDTVRTTHLRTHRWKLSPLIRVSTLRAFLKSDTVLCLLERVNRGWNDDDRAADFFTDAQNASFELKAMCESAFDAADEVGVWSASDWIARAAILDIWPEGMTLQSAMSQLQADAARDSAILLDPPAGLRAALIQRLLDAYESSELRQLSLTQRQGVEEFGTEEHVALLVQLDEDYASRSE